MPAGGSGAATARLFHRLLAAIFLVAWISLGAQVDVLLGARGLLPAGPYVEGLRAAGVPFLDAPAIFLSTGAGDGALHAGIAAGALLALLALLGVAPRLALGLGTLLYMSYATVGRTFLSFQWDNLLLECGLLAAFLPRDRRARLAHVAFRVLLFKLYWESGIAKWQSPLHDWQDGSAMTFYYETAPLPARLAWYAHALPASFPHLEAWFTLFFELALPLAIFGPRRARLAACAVFTGFQVVNVATANYGFFSYLSLALHVFLLDERDVVRLRARLERRLPVLRRLRARERLLALRIARALRRLRPPPAIRRGGAVAAFSAYAAASIVDAVAHFDGSGALYASLAPVHRIFAPYRLVSTYHLFAAITRERVEPEVQTFDGSSWAAHDLFHKPGDVARAPHLVAPHQPRVDFQLWFYGLSFRRGMPAYVEDLLDRLCHDPAAVQALFPAPLPEAPVAARMAFHQYHFTTPDERRATGAWWKRTWVGSTRPVACKR
jgi:hypothetical protein